MNRLTRELLRRYASLGASMSAMTQRDTPEQKELICQMIDECNAPTIRLDWDGVDVPKEDAKKYVMEYDNVMEYDKKHPA